MALRQGRNRGPVLHLTDALLPQTETFIQQRLRSRHLGSLALAWRRVASDLEIPCPSVILPDRRAGRLDLRARVAARALEEMDLWGAVRRLRPSVLHAHFGPVGLRVLRVARVLRLPLIVSFYGFDLGLAARPEFRKRYRSLFQYATLTAEGPHLKRRLLALGARRVRLLPLAIPDWCAESPQPRRDTSTDLRLLQVCRLVPKKGVDLSLHAVAALTKSGASVRLTVIGDGPERGVLEALRASLGIDAMVEFVGGRPYGELPQALAVCDALLQPSRTARDGDTEGGYPTVIVEAQAQGVPVIATRHADIPMVVSHGETGLLAAEDDPKALAACIQDFRQRNRQEMGARARQRALRRHGGEKVARLQEAIYRRVELP